MFHRSACRCTRMRSAIELPPPLASRTPKPMCTVLCEGCLHHRTRPCSSCGGETCVPSDARQDGGRWFVRSGPPRGGVLDQRPLGIGLSVVERHPLHSWNVADPVEQLV